MMRWKRVVSLLLAACMLLCLCACGGSNAETPATQSPQQSAKPSTPTSEVPEPPQTENPGAETLPPANHGDARTLSLQKQLYSLYDWDDDALLVQSEFSHVTLWQNDAAKYPKLAEALNQTANMVKRSMEDEYDNLCATAREELPWAGETSVSTLGIQVRRADSVVLSLLSDSYSDYGWIEDFRGMIAAIRPSETVTLKLVLSRLMDYLEENREIVTALIKVNAPDGFGKKMIGVIEECRMELLPYRSVEDAYAARFLATGVIGMTEKWITESQPIPKTEMVSLITKLLTPLVPQSDAVQN